MAGKVKKIALVGVGWIGDIHAECYSRIKSLLPELMPGCSIELTTVVDVDENLAKKAAHKYGFKNWTADWKSIVNNQEIDLIDICVNNNFHHDIAVQAAENKKDVLCEKPLATNVDEAKAMVDVAEKHKIVNGINFNYRKVPAIAYIKNMIEENEFGKLYYIKCFFEQDFAADPSMPISWRFKKSLAGGGSIVTMGSHMIDMARFLAGEISEVMSVAQTFMKKRPKPGAAKEFDISDVDDVAAVLAKYKNGQIGSFLTSWVSWGKRHHFEVELFGSKGSVFFNSERLNEIRLVSDPFKKAKRGSKTILIGEDHPYGNYFSLKTGMGIGIKESFTIQLFDFIKASFERTGMTPSFYDGLMVEKISAAINRSLTDQAWSKIA
jgi:predicted dehydrogenase